MIVVSFILTYIWPVIYGALVTFGTSIAKLGPVGAGIYGFFNRLLIPVGLHHAVNSVFWFNVAGINDIGRFWEVQQQLMLTYQKFCKEHIMLECIKQDSSQ